MPRNVLKVEGKEISTTVINGSDYISLTDMVKGLEDGRTVIGNWMRSKDTIEFLGVWERMHNAEKFKLIEFHEFKNQAGSGRFTMSPQKWVTATGAIGIVSKAGRYGGGTYAHIDIAFKFGAWLRPEFELLLLQEFRRLKSQESDTKEWNFRRLLSKVNYSLHTDAVRDVIVPKAPKSMEWLAYADEADLLNMAVFGRRAQEWRDAHPDAKKHENMRDRATLEQLTVLSNMESLNSLLIRKNIPREARFRALLEAAQTQLTSLSESRRQLARLDELDRSGARDELADGSGSAQRDDLAA